MIRIYQTAPGYVSFTGLIADKWRGDEEMYGWRARIGYISAGTGEVAGEELFKAAPEGVEVLHGNLFLGEDNSTEFERVSDSLE